MLYFSMLQYTLLSGVADGAAKLTVTVGWVRK